MSPGPRGHEFTIPLVSTASEGGPFHDESYVAGWEMGEIVAVLRELRPPEVERMVRTGSLPMLDLIAMRYGYAHTASRCQDGWTWVALRREKDPTWSP